MLNHSMVGCCSDWISARHSGGMNCAAPGTSAPTCAKSLKEFPLRRDTAVPSAAGRWDSLARGSRGKAIRICGDKLSARVACSRRDALRRRSPGLLLTHGETTGLVGENASSKLSLDQDQELAHLRSGRCSRRKTSSSLDGPETRLSSSDEGGVSSPRDAPEIEHIQDFQDQAQLRFRVARLQVKDPLSPDAELRGECALERPFSCRFRRTALPSCSAFPSGCPS